MLKDQSHALDALLWFKRAAEHDVGGVVDRGARAAAVAGGWAAMEKARDAAVVRARAAVERRAGARIRHARPHVETSSSGHVDGCTNAGWAREGGAGPRGAPRYGRGLSARAIPMCIKWNQWL